MFSSTSVHTIEHEITFMSRIARMFKLNGSLKLIYPWIISIKQNVISTIALSLKSKQRYRLSMCSTVWRYCGGVSVDNLMRLFHQLLFKEASNLIWYINICKVYSINFCSCRPLVVMGENNCVSNCVSLNDSFTPSNEVNAVHMLIRCIHNLVL